MNLTIQFLLINLHFVLSLLAALVSFGIAWLYFDAEAGRRTWRNFLPALGFFLLSLSFLAQALVVDQALFESSWAISQTAELAKTILRLGGYLALIGDLLLTPLQPKPRLKRGLAAFLPLSLATLSSLGTLLLPLLALGVGILYRRRATQGLERHLKPVALGFFLLALAELFGNAVNLRGTDNITLYNLVAPYS